MMKICLGIDVGTSKLSAAWYYHNRLYTIRCAHNLEWLPAYIGFNQHAKLVTGHPAKEQQIVRPEQTYHSFLRLLGRNPASGHLRAILPFYSFKVYRSNKGRTYIKRNDTGYDLTVLLAYLFKRLMSMVQKHINMKVCDAVLAIPAGGPFNLRHLVREAAQKAQLNVLDIIDSAVAAGMAYAQAHHPEGRCGILDIGAGFTGFAILECEQEQWEVRLSQGNEQIGGEEMTHAIESWILESGNGSADPADLPPAVRARLFEEAEKAKKTLTQTPKCTLDIPYLFPKGQETGHFQSELTRRHLEGLCQSQVKTILAFARDAVTKAQLQTQDINSVILAGGQSRMPGLHRQIEKMFKFPPVTSCLNLQASAQGAALHAATLLGEHKSYTMKRKVLRRFDNLKPGTLLTEDMKIDAFLGTGSFCYVYRIIHSRRDQTCAVKILKPEFQFDEPLIQRFRISMSLLKKVKHPNIVRHYEWIEDLEFNAVLMQYVDGETLAEFAERGKFRGLSLHRRLEIIVAIINGLIGLQENGILQGDLKPDNIMITSELIPKIFDFELARFTSNQINGRLPFKVTGTPRFMSPEHFSIADVYGEWSEIFSLGLIAYWLFTGTFPRQQENPEKDYLGMDFKKSNPIDPCQAEPSLNPALCNVISRCIARKRSDRYQSFDEILSEFKHLLLTIA